MQLAISIYQRLDVKIKIQLCRKHDVAINTFLKARCGFMVNVYFSETVCSLIKIMHALLQFALTIIKLSDFERVSINSNYILIKKIKASPNDL